MKITALFKGPSDQKSNQTASSSQNLTQFGCSILDLLQIKRIQDAQNVSIEENVPEILKVFVEFLSRDESNFQNFD